jgi:hypothetical protein
MEQVIAGGTCLPDAKTMLKPLVGLKTVFYSFCGTPTVVAASNLPTLQLFHGSTLSRIPWP